ncbi:MAG: tRNA (guanosine(46)-N7)-methyltransferase TrmB [Gammaproteobacteria bacterium]|nr:tRNA (guanosine(46)-N7)-methyltransferase TrmB [Gammaproteobacteria bacterium]
MTEQRHRTIRSYVLRKGRLTTAQQHALDELWPYYGIERGSTVLDFSDHFEREAGVILEIGFGNGESTWQMAQQEPEKNFVGIEVHKPGVGHLLMALEEHGIENVRIACEDAVPFVQQRIADGSLAGVRIYFADPWPKKRHHKRRIIQPDFVGQLSRCLAKGGILHLATDWRPYAEHMLEVMQGDDDFINLSPQGDYCERPEWRPFTKYEKRGEKLGHEVFDLLYQRV